MKALALSLVLVILCVYLTNAQLVKLQHCTKDDQCGQGECCAHPALVPIQSRKRQTLPKTGTCMRYTKAGSGCSWLDKGNGYCGCEPGTSCQIIYDRTPGIVGRKRGPIPFAHEECAKLH